MALTIALSWVLLLTHRNAHVQWSVPVVMTYIIVGLLPFKIGIVRKSSPLPPERIEEHYRWADAQRRYRERVNDCMSVGSFSSSLLGMPSNTGGPLRSILSGFAG